MTFIYIFLKSEKNVDILRAHDISSISISICVTLQGLASFFPESNYHHMSANKFRLVHLINAIYTEMIGGDFKKNWISVKNPEKYHIYV